MMGIMQNQNPAASGANECSHYASMKELLGVMQQQSGRACFASARCDTCSDIHCLWWLDCQQLSAYSALN